LKTLEEPPPNTIFVLATTEVHKVPATIVDRCHRFDFQRPSLEEITTVLRRIADAEEIEADDRTLAMIARSAAGSFRDAIGTLDQLVTYGGRQIAYDAVLEVLNIADADLFFRTTDALIAHDPGAALTQVGELSSSGRDPAQFMRDLVAHLRQLVVIQTIGEAPDSFSVTADQAERLEAQAKQMSQREAMHAIDLTSAALAAVKDGSDARIQLELALLKAAAPHADPSIEALLSRIEQLERKAGQGPDTGGTGGGKAGPASVGQTRAEKPSKGGGAAETEEAGAGVAANAAPDPETPSPLASQSLDAIWPAALERVRAIEGGAMLAALLSGARPISLDDRRLVVSYPPSAAFSKRKVEDPVNRDRISGALRLVTGQAVVLECELGDDEPSEEGAGPGRPEDALSEEELIARIKDVFDAEDVLEETSEGTQ
jgi:DNA polymerase-3 subunit gamma/tau